MAITSSKPCFLPFKAIKTKSVTVDRGDLRRACMARTRTARSDSVTCIRLGEGRVFLKSSNASSEFNILMVSAIATSSVARAALEASWSLAVCSQSCLRPARNFSSASLVSIVSFRSFFSVTTFTARSPARPVFSSMAWVEAAISLFFAATIPLWAVADSFSALVISPRLASISSFIVFRIPTICPEAGAYSEVPCRKACSSDFWPSVSCIDTSAILDSWDPAWVCKKDPAIPFSIAGIASLRAPMLAFKSPLSAEKSEFSLDRMEVASSMADLAAERSSLWVFKSDSVCFFSAAVESMLASRRVMAVAASSIDFSSFFSLD
mmetsp:Transcript_19773/g.43902  ORF Transcript_19773/g.43902 Transcript_19773/m.43902 type:complete len:322 (+) Transcript_19773:344-1309(+)